MLPIENRTPFPAELLTLLDSAGREVRVLVIVGTFEWRGSPRLALAAAQEPVCFADVHRGDPRFSSVRREADACMPKPLVDVVVEGCAYAPAGGAATEVAVRLSVADIDKQLRVTGDRLAGGLFGAGAGPASFERMPIIYERAAGGGLSSGGPVDPCNPVGVGYRGAPSADPSIATVQPNIEHHTSASAAARKLPAGFGVIGRGWQPRLQLAGSYDEAWLRDQWPLPPRDFDERHYQCAPADQQSANLRGGEAVKLTNMTPEGLWEFHLPLLQVPVHAIADDRPRPLQPRIDTVLIRPERRQVVLCQRTVVPAPEGVAEAREVVIGHMTAAWLRARCARRRYLDFGRSGGEQRARAYFT